MPTVRRPSPALIVAIAALVVAGTGTTYAVAVAPNSVGTAQLKANAVTTAKVKDGTLRVSDFRAADRSSLRGPAGAAGAAGTPGETGAQGVPGQAGPSEAQVGFREGALGVPFASAPQIVVPQAGTYLLMVTAMANATIGGGLVTCSLKAGSVVVGIGEVDLNTADTGAVAIVSSSGLPAAGVVSLECGHDGGTHTVTHIRLVAVRIGNVVTINLP